ncbi:MAG: hypothetical protein NUV51_01620 [Sulfuricaulis sp.]|nr:hypothetical protein [Sulfuricaulis sp.]
MSWRRRASNPSSARELVDGERFITAGRFQHDEHNVVDLSQLYDKFIQPLILVGVGANGSVVPKRHVALL